MSDLREATELLFNERKNFIVIGLTGRTGSGCSTVAQLLSKSFEELNPTKPKYNDFQNNDERKYSILYSFAQYNWDNFRIIKMRDVITTFILEHSLTSFVEKVKQRFNGFTEGDASFVNEYNSAHEKRIRIRELTEGNEEYLKEDEVYNYYFIEIPQITKSIEERLRAVDASAYSSMFQLFGNNIRMSGDAFNDNFIPNNILKLSQRTNKLIKILRKRNLQEKGKVLVVIDALRNPVESTFFKERYSGFYLFSVNTDETSRRERLYSKGLNLAQIAQLDAIEYPERSGGISKFAYQNIQNCIEISDVHLYNPTRGSSDFSFLKEQLVKYVSLIMHPGLVNPSHMERCMQVAYNVKFNSGCLSRQVGAVITDDNYAIKAVGWNHTPEGQVPCNLRNLEALLQNDDKEAFSEFELNNERYREYLIEKTNGKLGDREKLKGRLFPYCFKDAYNGFKKDKNQVHTRSLHAEENAFLQVSKYGGQGLKDGLLFTTASPCELCSKKAYQIGVRTVIYVDPYPGISTEHVLGSGANRPEMRLFHGALGRAYHQLYTPILPYKDELYMLSDVSF